VFRESTSDGRALIRTWLTQLPCGRRARAQDFGYTDVFVMPEGIAGWEKAKLPVETG
jgi:hypothetical protein